MIFVSLHGKSVKLMEVSCLSNLSTRVERFQTMGTALNIQKILQTASEMSIFSYTIPANTFPRDSDVAHSYRTITIPGLPDTNNIHGFVFYCDFDIETRRGMILSLCVSIGDDTFNEILASVAVGNRNAVPIRDPFVNMNGRNNISRAFKGNQTISMDIADHPFNVDDGMWYRGDPIQIWVW